VVNLAALYRNSAFFISNDLIMAFLLFSSVPSTAILPVGHSGAAAQEATYGLKGIFA
jgi:hypothetical protein